MPAFLHQTSEASEPDQDHRPYVLERVLLIALTAAIPLHLATRTPLAHAPAATPDVVAAHLPELQFATDHIKHDATISPVAASNIEIAVPQIRSKARSRAVQQQF